jgi:hypothetical protein
VEVQPHADSFRAQHAAFSLRGEDGSVTTKNTTEELTELLAKERVLYSVRHTVREWRALTDYFAQDRAERAWPSAPSLVFRQDSPESFLSWIFPLAGRRVQGHP